MLNRYHVGLLAYLLDKLQKTPDGDGTLLDHSLVLYGSAMGDGNQHNHYPLPIVLAGGASGKLKGGKHIRNAGGHDDVQPAGGGAGEAERPGREVRGQRRRYRALRCTGAPLLRSSSIGRSRSGWARQRSPPACSCTCPISSRCRACSFTHGGHADGRHVDPGMCAHRRRHAAGGASALLPPEPIIAGSASERYQCHRIDAPLTPSHWRLLCVSLWPRHRCHETREPRLRHAGHESRIYIAGDSRAAAVLRAGAGTSCSVRSSGACLPISTGGARRSSCRRDVHRHVDLRHDAVLRMESLHVFSHGICRGRHAADRLCADGRMGSRPVHADGWWSCTAGWGPSVAHSQQPDAPRCWSRCTPGAPCG